MKKNLKRYRAFLIAVFFILIFTAFNMGIGLNALKITGYSFKEMLLVIPPIFILLGLLDVWVPKETMIKYMGDKSGLKGILLAIFIGAWSTTKIPMILFEIASLGTKFAITRLLIDIPGIIIIAFILSKMISNDEVKELYRNAEKLNA